MVNELIQKMSEEINCKAINGIKKIYVINRKDVKFESGVMKIKRKYGKFKRDVYFLEPNKNN